MKLNYYEDENIPENQVLPAVIKVKDGGYEYQDIRGVVFICDELGEWIRDKIKYSYDCEGLDCGLLSDLQQKYSELGKNIDVVHNANIKLKKERDELKKELEKTRTWCGLKSYEMLPNWLKEDKPNLCIDCKHYKEDDIHRCIRSLSPIDGKKRDRVCGVERGLIEHYNSVMRDRIKNLDICGEEGKYWDAK
jgi:hypothetical protein